MESVLIADEKVYVPNQRQPENIVIHKYSVYFLFLFIFSLAFLLTNALCFGTMPVYKIIPKVNVFFNNSPGRRGHF